MTQLHRLTLPFNFGSDSEPQIRPPAVAFVWGPFEFQGFITILTNEFLLFDEEGGVRRVQSSLKLQGRAMGAASDVDSLLDGDYTPGKQSASGNAGSKTSASRKDILASLLK